MFECVIELVVPLKYRNAREDSTYTTQHIARYSYDPGLQVGEQFWVYDETIGTWEDKPFSFKALVKERQKTVIPRRKSEADIFRLSIIIEAADKEKIARIAEVIKKLNPGVFEE